MCECVRVCVSSASLYDSCDACISHWIKISPHQVDNVDQPCLVCTIRSLINHEAAALQGLAETHTYTTIPLDENGIV